MDYDLSNRAGRHIVGIDIGGTKLATVVADREGQILQKIRRPTEAQRGPGPIIKTIAAMVQETLTASEVDWQDVLGVGVSCGGPLDSARGVVYSPPNLPGWDAVPLKDELAHRFAVPVLIENDANAGALAEWMFGAGRGYRNLIYLTMGTGIGGGLILDGRLYRGTNDSAGEVGHMTLVSQGPLCGCGKRGCLEALCSGPAIARRAREALARVPESQMAEAVAGNLAAVTAETVVTAARTGDWLAQQILDETARYMAQGLGHLVNVLNPQLIVIGTIAVKAGDLLLEPIRKYLQQETWARVYQAVRVKPAQLGDYVGDWAAIAIVRQFMAPLLSQQSSPI